MSGITVAKACQHFVPANARPSCSNCTLVRKEVPSRKGFDRPSMKSHQQLAQAAYEAYCKHAVTVDDDGLSCYAKHWSELDPGTRACWLAAVEQVVSDVAVKLLNDKEDA